MKKLTSIAALALSLFMFSCASKSNADGTTDSLKVDTTQTATSSNSAATDSSESDSAKADTLAMSAEPTRSQQ